MAILGLYGPGENKKINEESEKIVTKKIARKIDNLIVKKKLILRKKII